MMKIWLARVRSLVSHQKFSYSIQVRGDQYKEKEKGGQKVLPMT